MRKSSTLLLPLLQSSGLKEQVRSFPRLNRADLIGMFHQIGWTAGCGLYRLHSR
jgi:hypothetical protein